MNELDQSSKVRSKIFNTSSDNVATKRSTNAVIRNYFTMTSHKKEHLQIYTYIGAAL